MSSLWDNAPLLVLASLAFTLACAPAYMLFLAGLYVPAAALGVVAIAPSWASLLALVAEVVRRPRPNFVTMLRAFPRYWARSAAFGLAAAFPLIAARYTFPMFGLAEVPGFVWVSIFAEVSLGGLFLALSIYAFPLVVLYDMGVKDAVRNAAVLSSRHISNTAGLVSMALLFGMAVGYVASGLLFFLPTVWGLFIVNNCRLVVTEALAAGGDELAQDPAQTSDQGLAAQATENEA